MRNEEQSGKQKDSGQSRRLSTETIPAPTRNICERTDGQRIPASNNVLESHCNWEYSRWAKSVSPRVNALSCPPRNCGTPLMHFSHDSLERAEALHIGEGFHSHARRKYVDVSTTAMRSMSSNTNEFVPPRYVGLQITYFVFA